MNNMNPLEIINYYRNLYYAEPSGTENYIVANAINDLISQGNIVPSAYWVISSNGYYPYCSNCNHIPKHREMTRHCPECGAIMWMEQNFEG